MITNNEKKSNCYLSSLHLNIKENINDIHGRDIA